MEECRFGITNPKQRGFLGYLIQQEFMDSFKDVGIDISAEEIYALENDPKLKKHMQLMIWAAMMRCFLDALYFYFGD